MLVTRRGAVQGPAARAAPHVRIHDVVAPGVATGRTTNGDYDTTQALARHGYPPSYPRLPSNGRVHDGA